MKTLYKEITADRLAFTVAEIHFKAIHKPDTYMTYVIHSDVEDNQNKAYLSFWDAYNKKGPYEKGNIYWHMKPVLVEMKNADGKKVYQIMCRFSIVHGK